MLQIAAEQGFVEVIIELLRNGVNIDTTWKDKDGNDQNAFTTARSKLEHLPDTKQDEQDKYKKIIKLIENIKDKEKTLKEIIIQRINES